MMEFRTETSIAGTVKGVRAMRRISTRATSMLRPMHVKRSGSLTLVNGFLSGINRPHSTTDKGTQVGRRLVGLAAKSRPTKAEDPQRARKCPDLL
jgi:hypothetical protein